MISEIFKISRFNKIFDKSIILFIVLTIFLLSIGIYFAIIGSPEDYQQGAMVRIMYIHVPSAWMSLIIYSFIAISSISYLIWRNPIANIIAYSAAPIGTLFALSTLVTGSIWGKPIWGTWWVWDARLTSMLVLFFFYIGYLSLIYSVKENNLNHNAPPILAIMGFVNVPIVKFSVDIWNSLHQPASIIRTGGVAIDISMMKPLILMFIFCVFYFFTNLILKVKTEILDKKIKRLNNY